MPKAAAASVGVRTPAKTSKMAEALAAHDASPEAAAICREFAPTLRRALRAICRNDRLVALAWLEDLTLEQIAGKLRRTINQVRESLQRCFEHLRIVQADWRVIQHSQACFNGQPKS